MAYSYVIQKPRLFTEDGLRMFTAYRDRAIGIIREAGAFMSGKLVMSGEGWDVIACADLMIERGELREVTGPEVFGQHRVFVAGPSFPQTRGER